MLCYGNELLLLLEGEGPGGRPVASLSIRVGRYVGPRGRGGGQLGQRVAGRCELLLKHTAAQRLVLHTAQLGLAAPASGIL